MSTLSTDKSELHTTSQELKLEFQEDTILIKKAYTFAETLNTVENILEEYSSILPSSDSIILLKPNLNNDLNALTGNSTDLRVIVATLQCLKSRGYNNIIIGDGSNVGIDRKNIDVISRLKIDRIGKKYGVKTINLNREKSKEVKLNDRYSFRIAQICFDADFIINLPTIKTHAEAQFSCVCKNLVGCITGGLEKKKIHYNLVSGLFRLNEIIQPHLHIVDGLIGMEGNGPGDGIPKKLGIIVSGTKAFLIDSVIAYMVGFDIEEIGYLRLAKELGHINDNDIQLIYTVPLLFPVKKAPPRPFLSKVLGHNKLMKLRDITRPLFSLGLITNMLYRTKIIQDVYENDDANITDLNINVSECLKGCNRCKDVCPMGINVTSNDFNFQDDQCIQCLYCYWICPTNAIKIEGRTGYLQQHFQRYKHHVEKLQN